MSYADTKGPGYVLAHRKAVAACRRRWKEAGVCWRCGRPVVRWNLCERHARASVESAKRRRHRRAAAGLCTRCGQHAVFHNLCRKHLEQSLLSLARRTARNTQSARVLHCSLCGHAGHLRNVCGYLTTEMVGALARWAMVRVPARRRGA